MVESSENLLWNEQSFSDAYTKKDYNTIEFYKMIKDLNFTTVLDVGCARGGLFKALHSKSKKCKYTGIDISRNMILANKKEFRNAKWHIGSVTKLPFPDSSFDIVVCADVLIHLPSDAWKQGFDECVRVSKRFAVLRIRTKLFGKTVHGFQNVSGKTVPYVIFGSDFFHYIKRSARLVEKKSSLRLYDTDGKYSRCFSLGFPYKHHIPAFVTSLVLEKKC